MRIVCLIAKPCPRGSPPAILLRLNYGSGQVKKRQRCSPQRLATQCREGFLRALLNGRTCCPPGGMHQIQTLRCRTRHVAAVSSALCEAVGLDQLLGADGAPLPANLVVRCRGSLIRRRSSKPCPLPRPSISPPPPPVSAVCSLWSGRRGRAFTQRSSGLPRTPAADREAALARRPSVRHGGTLESSRAISKALLPLASTRYQSDFRTRGKLQIVYGLRAPDLPRAIEVFEGSTGDLYACRPSRKGQAEVST